jgi:hypothetical protein
MTSRLDPQQKYELENANGVLEAIGTIFDEFGSEEFEGQIPLPLIERELEARGFEKLHIMAALATLGRYGRLKSEIVSFTLVILNDRAPVTPEDSKEFVTRTNAQREQLLRLVGNMQRAQKGGGE